MVVHRQLDFFPADLEELLVVEAICAVKANPMDARARERLVSSIQAAEAGKRGFDRGKKVELERYKDGEKDFCVSAHHV